MASYMEEGEILEEAHPNPEAAPVPYHDMEGFPAFRPLGFPHVINLNTFSAEAHAHSLWAVDAVATILIKQTPVALHAFMDIENYHQVSLRRELQNHDLPTHEQERLFDPASLRAEFPIYSDMFDIAFVRLGRTVKISTTHGSWCCEAPVRHCSILYRIDHNGKWAPQCATHGSTMISRGTHDTDEQRLEEVGATIAKHFITGRKWEEVGQYEIKIYARPTNFDLGHQWM